MGDFIPKPFCVVDVPTSHPTIGTENNLRFNVFHRICSLSPPAIIRKLIVPFIPYKFQIAYLKLLLKAVN